MCRNRVPARREMDGDMLLVGVEAQAVWLWGVLAVARSGPGPYPRRRRRYRVGLEFTQRTVNARHRMISQRRPASGYLTSYL
jgi:hypothetical protein